MRVKHSPSRSASSLRLAPGDELCGGTQEIVLQQKAINPVSRSSFVVHLILAGGEMIENSTEAECASVWQNYVCFMARFGECLNVTATEYGGVRLPGSWGLL